MSNGGGLLRGFRQHCARNVALAYLRAPRLRSNRFAIGGDTHLAVFPVWLGDVRARDTTGPDPECARECKCLRVQVSKQIFARVWM